MPNTGELECLEMKMIGKPYAGELQVRFDEGEQDFVLWKTLNGPDLAYSFDVTMPERTRRCIVDLAHVRGEALEPIAHFRSSSGVGFWKGKFMLDL